MLQYLISGNNAQEIINTTTSALDNGCRWIRLDMGDLPHADVEATIKSLQEKCNVCEAYLSIENDVETVAKLKVQGTHLGIKHLPKLIDIRKTLGEEPIIGLTIEEPAQVPFLPRTAIDYVAIDGSDLENCRGIVSQMRDSNFDEPVVATLAHGISVDELMATGVDGIAVHHTTTLPSMLQTILKELGAIMQQRLKGL